MLGLNKAAAGDDADAVGRGDDADNELASESWLDGDETLVALGTASRESLIFLQLVGGGYACRFSSVVLFPTNLKPILCTFGTSCTILLMSTIVYAFMSPEL